MTELEYLVYLPASQSLTLSKLERPVDEAVLEEAWSGLLVSVHVVLCTEKAIFVVHCEL